MNELKTLLASDKLFGITALGLASKVCGPEAVLPFSGEGVWDPETVRHELTRDVGPVSDASFNRLMAAIQVASGDGFFKRLDQFVVAVNGLAGGLPPFTQVLPDCSDIAWGVTEGLLIWPPDKSEQEPFAEEIIDFISATIRREGILSPPDVLRIGLKADGALLAARVKISFDDDPALASAVSEMQFVRSQEIDDNIRHNLTELTRQLGLLGDPGISQAIASVWHEFAT